MLEGPGGTPLRFTISRRSSTTRLSATSRVRFVWQWSANRAFLQVVLDEITHGRSWTVQVPLTDLTGASLPAGKYTFEAWIVSGHDRPQFAGVAPFQIPEKE